MERELEKQYNDFQNPFEIAGKLLNMGIIEWDIDSQTISLSGQMMQISGLDQEDGLDFSSIFDLLHEDFRDSYRLELEKRFSTHCPNEKNHIVFNVPLHYRIVKPNRTLEYCKEYGILYFKNGSPHKYISTVVDNSESVRKEWLLTKKEKYYRELIESMHNSFIVLKGVNKIEDIYQDYVILNMNPAFLEHFQLNHDDVFEKPFKNYFPEIADEIYKQCEITLSDGKPTKTERYFPKHKYHTNITYQRLTSSKLFLIIEDITDKKNFQNNMLKSIINAEEKVRTEIANEMHDGIGPLLAALKMNLESFSLSSDEKLKSKIKIQINEIIHETISNVRTISNNLSPHILKNYGLEKALNKFVQLLKHTHNHQFHTTIALEDRPPQEIETTLYRVTTEIINNSCKYSHAENIYLDIYDRNNIIYVNFRDDGKGFDFDKQIEECKGLGLFNIKSRIESLEGEISYTGRPDKGVEYNIFIPKTTQ